MSVLIVSNVATPRARRRVPELRRALPESAGVEHRLTEQAADMEAAVCRDWAADDLLVINGGDGSVQGALTTLFRRGASTTLPRLACLPGGSTNMTAFDINQHRDYGDCLGSLARLVREPWRSEAPRPVVRVRGADGTPTCGLFFGIGTIVDGVEYFQRRLRGEGGRHELTAGIALARTVWGIARRQPPFDRTLSVRLRGGDWHDDERSLRLLFATTLDRLFLGMRPYWGDRAGALKVTAVEQRAPGFLQRMPRLLRGRPDDDMTPEAGYHSRRLDELTLAFRGSYTIDGELFASHGDTMRVSATDPVRFVPL